MKKNIKLPTILGLVILVFGLVAGIFLINSSQVFKLGANEEAEPKNVRVSNITNNSVTVTWTTDILSSGFVKWGKNNLTLTKIALEQEEEKGMIHTATIFGIDKGSQVSFIINSNGKDYNNNNVPWNTSTLQNSLNINSTNLTATGTILNSDGATPAKAIVYLVINGNVISGTTSKEGNFVIPVSSYIEQINDTQAIEISVQGGKVGTSQAVIYPKSIASIPAIVLGKTYDFRTAEVVNSNQKPESSLTIPESVEQSSRFEITKNENTEENNQSIVTVESIEEGEIITTTDPEFFGSGPQNSELTIEIHSELQTATISTDNKGDWNWSPPDNLEPGEHKVVLKWKDTSGILRTLTRTFIVSAAEGPAFESTPSATPDNEVLATATAKSSSTPTIISSPIATNQPVPETGSLTPTIGLFMIGFGILMSGFFIYSKANEY